MNFSQTIKSSKIVFDPNEFNTSLNQVAEDTITDLEAAKGERVK